MNPEQLQKAADDYLFGQSILHKRCCEECESFAEKCSRLSKISFLAGHAVAQTEIESRDRQIKGWIDALEITNAGLKERNETIERLTQERDRLASDALAALSQYTGTPEAGYVAEPIVLMFDIDRVGKERDSLKTQLAAAVEALAWISKGPTWGPGAPTAGEQVEMQASRSRKALARVEALKGKS